MGCLPSDPDDPCLQRSCCRHRLIVRVVDVDPQRESRIGVAEAIGNGPRMDRGVTPCHARKGSRVQQFVQQLGRRTPTSDDPPRTDSRR